MTNDDIVDALRIVMADEFEQQLGSFIGMLAESDILDGIANEVQLDMTVSGASLQVTTIKEYCRQFVEQLQTQMRGEHPVHTIVNGSWQHIHTFNRYAASCGADPEKLLTREQIIAGATMYHANNKYSALLEQILLSEYPRVQVIGLGDLTGLGGLFGDGHF